MALIVPTDLTQLVRTSAFLTNETLLVQVIGGDEVSVIAEDCAEDYPETAERFSAGPVIEITVEDVDSWRVVAPLVVAVTDRERRVLGL